MALGACLLHLAACVKVKMVMHSDEDNSRMDDEEPHTEAWEHKKKATASPFKIRSNFDEDRPATDKALKALHPNDMFFPLVFKQAHINNMFKFGDNWYTWTTDKRSDGTAALTYYVCYEEPKHCDDVGWVSGRLLILLSLGYLNPGLLLFYDGCLLVSDLVN